MQFVVKALDDAGAGSNEVVISLPEYFTINGGTPGGFTVQPGYPAALSRFNDVVWQTSLATSVPQTFSLTATPGQATTHAFHDEVSGHVHRAGAGLHEGAGDMLFVRVGTVGQPGAVAEHWPDALAVLSEGFVPGNPDGSHAVAFDGQGIEVPLDTATVEELPETEPLSVGIDYDPIVAAGIPVGLRVVIHNTIASTVSFTGTVTLPEDWPLVTGQAAINASLPPGETMVVAYQVLPQTIRCDWTTTVYLRVDAATIAQCHDDVLLKQRGGMYPCGGEGDWLLTGQVPGVRKAYTADTERIPVRPNPACGQPGPCAMCTITTMCPIEAYTDSTMTVRGRILALSQHEDSYLARLRLRVLEGNRQPPNIGITPTMTGRVLAEVRLDDWGQFSVCVERVPNFFLEVLATDELTCPTPWAAETVFERHSDGADPKRYFAYSPVFAAWSGAACGWGIDLGDQYVDLWGAGMTTVRAAAFFPATQIAYEMEDFFSGHAAQTLRDSGALRPDHDYRASFVYPVAPEACINEANPDPSLACYRPPHIYLANMDESGSYNAAVVGKVIEHEYGHRAHDAKGGWPDAEVGCNFCESVAEFIRAAKEDNAITRGEDARYLPWPTELDDYRNNNVPADWIEDYYQWAPWLYDLFEASVITLDSPVMP